MHTYYSDIISRIDQEPSWYMAQGFPRFDVFTPDDLSVYWDYAALYLIECQSCAKPFYVGRAIHRSDMMEVAVSLDSIKHTFLADVIDNTYCWLPMHHAIYLPRYTIDENDVNSSYRYIPIEDYVKDFHYGDPPNHGCVGDTMNSVPKSTIEVWDRYIGKVVQDGVIKTFGTPGRLAELEGMDLTPEWATQEIL